MSKSKEPDIFRVTMKAHKQGVKNAIDLSARTGVPLVIFEDGKIKKVKAPYKYVRVPLRSAKKKK